MKALIDTCVILDVLLSRKPFCDSAQELFISAANNLFDGFISAKSVTDIYYIVHRCTHSDRETRLIIGKLLDLFRIADTTGADCRLALLSDISDYEDAVLAESAVSGGFDCIVTRNIKDFKNCCVKIYSTENFNSLISTYSD